MGEGFRGHVLTKTVATVVGILAKKANGLRTGAKVLTDGGIIEGDLGVEVGLTHGGTAS